MNKFEKSLYSVTQDPKEAIKIIADNMIETRPAAKVEYRPFHKSEIYYDLPIVGPRYIDIKKLHPHIKSGDVVYISAILDSCNEYEVKINFIGDAKVFLDSKEIFDSKGECDRHSVEAHLRAGETPITFAVKCHSDEKCEFYFMPSVRYYWMWARYYLLHVKVKSPIPYYKGEEGVAISAVYKDGEQFDGRYVYPTPIAESRVVNFADSYGDCDGEFAYAMTNASSDTSLSVSFSGKGKVFVNGIERSSYDNMPLEKGDTVLVKLQRSENWAFEFSGADISPKMLTSERRTGDEWVIVGAFGDNGDIDTPMGPEALIDFTKPYKDKNGEPVYWKLAAKNEYVRPTLFTRFFGQWFYAHMVGTYGLLSSSYALNNKEYFDYFVNSTKILASYFDYAQYDAQKFKQATFLQVSTNLDNLDAIGAMGRNLCELYKIEPGDDVGRVIDILADAAKNNIPRFEDGTYHRPYDMWADDLFMSCPFLMRYAAIKGDNDSAKEVVRQLLGFKSRLWMPDEQIMSHIFFLDTNEPNNVPWGRGNGWVYVSLSDALENLPRDIEGYDELMKFYLEYTEGIIKLQDADGLWHQVLNINASYQETSCTGMFMLGICRGIKNGWLDSSYKAYAERAFVGLLKNKIASDGNVYDVCMGSSNSKNADYYMNLGAVDNDDHGTGVILTAISEYLKVI